MCFLLLVATCVEQQCRERIAVRPRKHFQCLLHCWQWSVFINNTKGTYVSRATVVTWMPHDVTWHTLPNLLLSSVTTLYLAHKFMLQLRWSVSQPLNTRTRIWFEAKLGSIWGGQNHIRKSCPPSTLFYPVRTIPSGPIYYQYYVTSATDSVVKHHTLGS